MKGNQGQFIPALGFRVLTRLYDPVLRAMLKEERFKTLLVGQAECQPGHRVLDLGCGTGTLTLMLKRACPGAQVVGLDVDPETLAIARSKAERSGVEVAFEQGLAWELPFAAGSFDRVVTSLLFHHLRTEDKRRTLRTLREVLAPEGELHIADWGKARSLAMRAAFLAVQLLDGFETTSDNVRGRLTLLMREAGLSHVAETHCERTVFGTLSLYRAERGT